MIDADRLGHAILKSPAAYRKIVKTFGPKVLKKNRAIDRVKLAQVVFSRPAGLAKLNRIIHPEIIRRIRRLIERAKNKFIVLDAALILEAGLLELVDKLVVVVAKKEQQIKRGQKKLGLSRHQMLQRIKSQISQKVKLRFADFIIDNSSQLSKTKQQVAKIRRQLWKS